VFFVHPFQPVQIESAGGDSDEQRQRYPKTKERQKLATQSRARAAIDDDVRETEQDDL
jgi:hypothetical protein